MIKTINQIHFPANQTNFEEKEKRCFMYEENPEFESHFNKQIEEMEKKNLNEFTVKALHVPGRSFIHYSSI